MTTPMIYVRLAAVDWLKKHYPALCEKSGLCERVAGRLYVRTTLDQSPHLDDMAVDAFAAEMKSKLAQKCAEGRCGWQNKTFLTQDQLSQMLRTHVEKSDPVDVANFCMMLHLRGEHIVTSRPNEATAHRKPQGYRIYLSGPISGLPELNRPAFHAEAVRLRALGYRVVNPADINPEPNKTWEDCLRADLIELLGCDAIALLPGWQKSKDAHLELHVAHRVGIEILDAAEIQTPANAPLPQIDDEGNVT